VEADGGDTDANNVEADGGDPDTNTVNAIMQMAIEATMNSIGAEVDNFGTRLDAKDLAFGRNRKLRSQVLILILFKNK
jgi:hypothetical protein